MNDVVIIGGGVIGLLTAAELVAAGRRVTLLERGETGRESSWAGGGILSPLYPWRYPDPVTELARWSQAHYPLLAADVTTATGIDPEWTQNGLLLMAGDDTAQALAWADRFGYRLETVVADRLPDYEPVLASQTRPGLWMPDVAQIRNPRLVKALRLKLAAQGVVFRERCEVTAITAQDDRVSGVQTPAGRIVAERVVVTAGAWSGHLLAALGTEVPIEPVKGQMLLIRARPGLLSRIVLDDGHYLIPRRDGRVLVGSTMERSGYDKGTTEAARQELLAAAFELVPALRDYPLERQWAGLRPGSPDGIPYIGEYPAVKGLYLNSGHFRNGVVMAPASARLLADLLLGRPPILDPAPYSLIR